MDKRINQRVDEYIIEFKRAIKGKVAELGLADNDFQKTNELLEFVFEYQRLSFQSEEFIQKKTSGGTAVIDEEHRCKAIRASGEPCNRRKKNDCDFCGTHDKCATKQTTDQKKKEVTAEEIDGIIYYIDLDGNVYHTEDVLEDKKNPRIIARLPRKVGVTNYTMDQVEWLTEFRTLLKGTYESLRDPL